MKALLIVDVQNDFLPGGALGVPGGDEILPIINTLLTQFPLVVATQDWHPPNHISFALTHDKEPGEVIVLKNYTQILWPVHCVQETEGAALSPHLHQEKIQKIFYKGIDPSLDSYSAFFDNARKRSTGLDLYLKQKEVDHLYIVGLATDYCVKESVLDALSLGLKVTVVLEGCKGIDLHPGDIKKALLEMTQAGANLLAKAKV